MTSDGTTYWYSRFVFERALALIYLVAFLVAANQFVPLLGERGLLPAARFTQAVPFRASPSLFFFWQSDALFRAAAWSGAALSCLLLLGIPQRGGTIAAAAVWLLLWVLYLSFVNIGQTFYGFGWESLLLEAGFLAIFLGGRTTPPSAWLGWLWAWLLFRIMFGAGLIKLRGDPCWRDLTCLYYHYETQPLPNPLSRWFHLRPHWFQKAGVVFNHVAELVAPWFVAWPRVARLAAGGVMLAFQVTLILSGNLSFLNWLTIVPILACFDDGLLRHVLPAHLVERAARAAAEAEPSRAYQAAVWGLVAVVALLSVGPARNLLSPGQRMNTSFDRLALVNTYGAFGSVGRLRPEIVFEGTRDASPSDAGEWRAYEFPCKPGDVVRRPCVVAPYQYRLDWQIWFAAMSTPENYPWTLHLVWKLLHNDPGALGLLANDPFREAPPRWIRARLYRYEFTPRDDPSGAWWTRTLVRDWLPPLSADDPRLRRFLAAYGWGPDG